MTDANASHAMTLHVRHRPIARNAAQAAAWVLLGDDPAAWLGELATWNVPLDSIRLLPLPRSATDRTVIGVLAIPGDGANVHASPRALPYRRFVERLYVPADAQLHPPLSDAELRERCPWHAAVMHPTIGLIAFDAAEVMRAADLLDVPPAIEADWRGAEPATFADPRVRSIRALVQPSLQDVLDGGRDDIGTSSAKDLPPTEDESLTKQIGRRAKLGWIRALQKFLPAPKPGDMPRAGLADRLSAWASSNAARLAAQLQAARERELSRLMKMLESDPDKGLRYAMPLNASAGSRGTVEGGSSLVPRDPSFSLGSFFGSRPTSTWMTPWEQQQRLQNKYRELANRELALGRHRRAAYVFAELLGDVNNAARVLEEARFYRDAAVLYQKKLNNAFAAAKCLQRGGLVLEAAALFESVHQFEMAGDLHKRLGDEEEAARLYNAAAVAMLAKHDSLGAATLIERKLNDPDRALHLLSETWRSNGQQAEPCLRESFKLLARLDRHAEAERRLREFRFGAQRETRPSSLAGVLVNVANDYPAGPPRELARDAVRVIVGHALADESLSLERAALLQLLARTNAEDRLLSRDATRYREATTPKVAKPLPPKAATRDAAGKRAFTLNVVREIRLGVSDPHVGWRTIAAIEGGFIALAAHDGPDRASVDLVRGKWNEQIQRRPILQNGARHDGDGELRMAGNDRTVCIARVGSLSRFVRDELPTIFGWPSLAVASSGLLPEGVIFGIAAADNGEFHVLYQPPASEQYEDDVLLDRITADGRVMASVGSGVSAEALRADLRTVGMHAHEDHLVLTYGQHLRLFTRGEAKREIVLPGNVTALSAPPRLTALRVLVSLDTGGCAIVWPQLDDLRVFGTTLGDALPCFLGDGRVVAVGKDRLSVYSTNGCAIEHLGDVVYERPLSAMPVKVVRGELANQIALLGGDGVVGVWAIG